MSDSTFPAGLILRNKNKILINCNIRNKIQEIKILIESTYSNIQITMPHEYMDMNAW